MSKTDSPIWVKALQEIANAHPDGNPINLINIAKKALDESPKEDQQPSRDIRELSEVGELDSYINGLVNGKRLFISKTLQELFWKAVDAIRKTQPKDQQPSGDVAEKFLKEYYDNKHPLIYGLRCGHGFQKDEVVEVMKAFVSNTQPIKEDTPIDDELQKTIESEMANSKHPLLTKSNILLGYSIGKRQQKPEDKSVVDAGED